MSTKAPVINLGRVNYSAPTSPYSLPPEIDDVKKVVREIVNQYCIPLESKYLANGVKEHPASAEASVGEFGGVGYLDKSDWDQLTKVSHDAGIDTAHLPEEFGGMGLGVLGRVVIDAELNRSLVRLPRRNVPVPLYNCKGEQREKFLLPTVQGKFRWCYGQTEPNAGSDPGSMRTQAVLKGDRWVINGTKTFITGAETADYMTLLALTDPEKRQHGGITMFVVDMKSPGISMSPVHIWTSREPHQWLIHFQDVEVPAENVLGPVGGGFAQGQVWLALQDRVTRGSLAMGILSRGLELATAYVKDRTTFGRPLAERQAIQWMLVDVFIDLKCIRAISYECAARADAGEDVRYHAAMAKYMGGNWGHRSVDKLMQIFGGVGESTEFPITHWYHMLRHGRIGGGTDEIQRMLIARALINQGKWVWEA